MSKKPSKELTKKDAKLLSSRLYTEADFKDASRLERLGMYLKQPRLPISPSDEEYLMKLRQVWMITGDSLSGFESVRKVRVIHPDMKYETAQKYIGEAESLFGSIISRNKDMARAVLIDKARDLYEKGINGVTGTREIIDKDGILTEVEVELAPIDLKLAKEALTLIGKWELDRPDDQEDILKDLQLPDISFTTDPGALAEDIEFKEVSEDTDEEE